MIFQYLQRAIPYHAHYAKRSRTSSGADDVREPMATDVLPTSSERRISLCGAVSWMSEIPCLCRTSRRDEASLGGLCSCVCCDGHIVPSTEVREGKPVHHRDDRPLFKTSQPHPIDRYHGMTGHTDIPWPLGHTVRHTFECSDLQGTKVYVRMFACSCAFLASKLVNTTT